MKKLFAVFIMLLLVIPLVYCEVGVKTDDTIVGIATDINFIGGVVALNGSEVDVTIGGGSQIEFTPAQFTLAGTELTVSTSPGLESQNSITAIVWDDGQTTPVQVTFKVPTDYASGGAFRMFCDSDAVTTASQVDFSVYVNVDGLAFDASATDQTPVALAEAAGTGEMVTLTPATDFSALAAGNVITFTTWRDDVAAGTDNLEAYYLEFFYTASR